MFIFHMGKHLKMCHLSPDRTLNLVFAQIRLNILTFGCLEDSHHTMQLVYRMYIRTYF